MKTAMETKIIPAALTRGLAAQAVRQCNARENLQGTYRATLIWQRVFEEEPLQFPKTSYQQ